MRARDDPNPPIGAGSLSAWMRTGLTELRNTLYPDSNVAARQVESGMYGTATQYEVNQERQGETPSKEDDHGSVLNEKLRQIEASRDGRGRESPEMEKE